MAKLDLQQMLLDRLEKLEDVESKDEFKDVITKLGLDEVQRTIDNEYVNPIVKKTKEETVEKTKEEVRQAAVDEFVAGLGLDGVESVDAFKAYTKRIQATTEEKDEMVSRLEKELNELKPAYESTLKEVEKRNTLDTIIQSGFEPKYAEDVYTIASNKVSDDTDLETVLEQMKDSYKMFVSKPDDGGSYDAGGNDTIEVEPDEVDKWREEAGLKPKT